MHHFIVQATLSTGDMVGIKAWPHPQNSGSGEPRIIDLCTGGSTNQISKHNSFVIIIFVYARIVHDVSALQGHDEGGGNEGGGGRRDSRRYWRSEKVGVQGSKPWIARLFSTHNKLCAKHNRCVGVRVYTISIPERYVYDTRPSRRPCQTRGITATC